MAEDVTVGILDRSPLSDDVVEICNRFLLTAELCRHAGHASATEPVKDQVARLRVMEDVAHDGLVRDFRVVRVCVVDRVVLPFAYVRRERLTAV